MGIGNLVPDLGPGLHFTVQKLTFSVRESRGSTFGELMFSGIITAVGTVDSYDETSSILMVRCQLFADRPIRPGASLAIDGVCLTAAHFNEEACIGFDLGPETKNTCLLARKRQGDFVNIEYALKASDQLDGHIVQGHIDGIAEISSIETLEHGCRMRFSTPADLDALIVKKGSIAINGVSLTINETFDDDFSVCLVPYTLKATSFVHNRPGDRVHLETDIMGRYFRHFFERAMKEEGIQI